MEDREGPNTRDRAGRLSVVTGHLTRTRWPTIIRLVLLAVFMTVGNADTPLDPQFFSPVTFESQRLTNESPMVHPSRALRHGVVIKLASIVNQHFCYSHAYSLFTMSYHRMGERWASNMSANVVL